MNHKTRTIVLQMVLAFVVAILLVQLWLFTEALEATHVPDTRTLLAATLVSGAGCVAVWMMIGYFNKAESTSQE